MRKCLMTGILLMVACLAFGQTPKVLVYNPYTKKGDLPPEWLKNKVTQQQYDSLARLSQHYAVSYDHFKARGLTQDDIRRYVKRTEVLLSEAQLKNTTGGSGPEEWRKKGITQPDTCHFKVQPLPVGVEPLMQAKNDEGDEVVRYILYSDIDGYDTHVMVEVKLSKDDKGNTQFVVSRLLPYSVSGLRVENRATLRRSDGVAMREVSSGTFDAGGCTPVYFLQGFFGFDDAKGYKHMCSLNHQFFLKLGPDSDSRPANVAPTEGWGAGGS